MSALLGQTPLNEDDVHVFIGMYIISPSTVNPNRSQPLGTPAPPNANHDSHSKALVIGECFAIFFVLFFTLARLYVRKFRSRYWGADDWVIIPAVMGCIAYLGLDITAATKGCLGKHIWDCTYSGVAWYVLVSECQLPMFYFTVFTVKLSIALANRRITGMVNGSWSYIHWTFIGLFCCLIPITTFLNMFQCLPVAAGYNLWYDGSLKDPYIIKCKLDRAAISLGIRCLHILTDCALLCVPIFIVARLHMARAKKYRLIAIFAVGGMSTLASIIRNILIVKYLDDWTYQSYTIYCFDIIDITFACIVASLPALNGVFEIFLTKIKSSISSSLRSSKKSQESASTTLGSAIGPYQRADDESVRQGVQAKVNTNPVFVDQFEMQGYRTPDNWA